MKHIVMYSGGVGSWAAALRVVEAHGPEDVILLFTDTKAEDPDLYRFLHESAADLGAHLEVLCEGRDPWQVFFDKRMMGNTRADPCSLILKRDPAAKWVRERFAPGEATIYLGIDQAEAHRSIGASNRWAPYVVEFPLMDPPALTKCQVFKMLADRGIARPNLYNLSFGHNNCFGACVKAGLGHWAHLLRMLPDVYAHWEAKEQEFRRFIGKDVAILRDRQGGHTRPLTLKEFRERLQRGDVKGLDLFQKGGCGCFGEDADVEDLEDEYADAAPLPRE